ncbi:hypothetical protein D3C85_1728120 [compost metagenome]
MWDGMTLQKCRCTHDDRTHVWPDGQRYHVGFQAIAETYSRVKTTRDHVHQGIAFHDLQPDVRILLQKLADDRQQY